MVNLDKTTTTLIHTDVLKEINETVPGANSQERILSVWTTYKRTHNKREYQIALGNFFRKVGEAAGMTEEEIEADIKKLEAPL